MKMIRWNFFHFKIMWVPTSVDNILIYTQIKNVSTTVLGRYILFWMQRQELLAFACWSHYQECICCFVSAKEYRPLYHLHEHRLYRNWLRPMTRGDDAMILDQCHSPDKAPLGMLFYFKGMFSSEAGSNIFSLCVELVWLSWMVVWKCCITNWENYNVRICGTHCMRCLRRLEWIDEVLVSFIIQL